MNCGSSRPADVPAAREGIEMKGRVIWGLALVLTAALVCGGAALARVQGWEMLVLERDHLGFGPRVASPAGVWVEDFSPDSDCFRLGIIGVRQVKYLHRPFSHSPWIVSRD
jgi:hypothetical protein